MKEIVISALMLGAGAALADKMIGDGSPIFTSITTLVETIAGQLTGFI